MIESQILLKVYLDPGFNMLSEITKRIIILYMRNENIDTPEFSDYFDEEVTNVQN